MSDWTSEYLTLIEDCEAREQHMSDWERGFIDSLKAKIANGMRPTATQIDKLDQVWEKVTSRG